MPTKKVEEEKPSAEAQKPFIAEYQPLPKVEAKPEVKVETPKEKPSDIVKVKVLVGTLQFEQGTFSKGDTFTVTRERLKLFDQKDIQVII